jgi:hypothetical protein
MNGLEKEFPFCSNPDCELYVRAGDPGVMGSGNWAELPNGRIVGRSIYSGVYLCDRCGDANGVPFLHFIHELPCKLAAIT